MKKTSISCYVGTFCLAAVSALSCAQSIVVPLPLSGPAYYLAADAYKAYAQGDFRLALVKVDEAIRLRPDLDSLRALRERIRGRLQPGAVTLARPKPAPRKRVDVQPPVAVAASDAPALEQDCSRLSCGNSAVSAEPVLPDPDPGYAAADAAYTAIRDRNYAAALDNISEASRLAPDNAAYRRVLLEIAYLAVRAGQDDLALDAFRRADLGGVLTDAAVEDAAFAAVRAGRDAEASRYFKRAIDAAHAGHIAMAPQALFDARRAQETVSRNYGVIASVSRSGAGPASTSGSTPGPSASGNVQTGVEAYWRPFGYQNGKTIEVFGRMFETLRDNAGGTTGAPTAQTTLGARWKPLSETNLVLSAGRLVATGSLANTDWLAQLAYSSGKGSDLPAGGDSWWTAQWYAEAGRYFAHPQTYGVASAQAGRSLRLSAANPDLIVFPHLSLNADYNSLNNTKLASGAGPGVSLRYWFRGDVYNAPRSYVELSVQYRFNLGSDRRARGLFMTTTVSY
jgi:tetratricopeptide (TPR) repeat protein